MSDAALLELIERVAEEAGFDLVDFTIAGTSQRPVLRVKADLPDSRPGHGIGVGQCAALSRALERELEAGGLVGPRYRLEVSSPGLERPLRWARHWRRFVGRRVRVRARGWDRARTREIVALPDDAHVVLRSPDGEETNLALAEIRRATLCVDWDTIGKP